MRPLIQSSRYRFSACASLAVALFWCIAIAAITGGITGCSDADPLAGIRAQQEAGDFAGSLEPLRELLAERPDDSETIYLYGRALAATGRSDLATWSLRKVLEDPEWLVPAGMQLAFAALAATDFNEVVEVTGRILEVEPDNAQALLMRASANAHWKKNPDLALADANRLLELNPDALEAYEPRILALLALERFDEASASLAEAGEKLVEAEAGASVLAWHCSTSAAFAETGGSSEEAREIWLRCLEAHPTELEAVAGAVRFYDTQGEPERSLEVLRAALEGAPDSRILRVRLADRLRARGEPGEAESVLREATGSENPEVAAAAWMDIASHRQRLEEYGAAADAMEQAVELAREAGIPSPDLEFTYADALLLAERFDLALEVAEELTVPAHKALIRARVAQERREPALALERFEEALALWPDNPWARYYAALAAEELGDFERSLAEYRYSIRISPGATDARTRGATQLFAGGNAGPARQMLLTGQAEAPLEMDGQLLSIRLAGFLGDMNAVGATLAQFEAGQPTWSGRALAAAAEGVAKRAGAAAGLGMLAGAPVDYTHPRYAAALRVLIRFAHEVGEVAGVKKTLAQGLALHPTAGLFHELRALDLELSGAAPEEVRGAYARALELAPVNAWAMAGLARNTAAADLETAVALYDQAAAVEPSDPAPQLAAAGAIAASGRLAEARRRLDRLLLEHPFEAEAAAACVRLDLERGISGDATLERARRAVRAGGGADAFELLSRVHRERGEAEPAEGAAKRAESLRSAVKEAGEHEPS